jgi:subtilisin family serine protease
VISISWGFYDDHPRIKTALVKAHSKNIVILAAAANHGRMDRIAFPARLRDYVICIGAARGDGVTADFTAEDPYYQSFTAPGQGVLGANIRHTSWWGGCASERKDGTSSATPIAAGVAALFIEYSRRNNLGKAGSRENMLNLFSAMSAESGDTYRLLRPWTLLDKEEVKAVLDDRKTDRRTPLKIGKGSSVHYLLISIIDTNTGVQILLENMDGTTYSLPKLLISQHKKKQNCLNGFPLTMIILADGMGLLSKDVPKTQENGS